MMTSAHALLGSNYRFDGSSGEFVNTSHARVAEIINDYDPTLSLAWIPKANRGPEDVLPYALIHSPVGGQEYVMTTLREDQIDNLLERVLRMDMANTNPLADIEAHNSALELINAKKHEDEAAERAELTASIIRSPKNTYKHNGVKYQ